MLARDDARILEIGANDGIDTVGFLAAFPTGTIDCFEPDPRAIARWRARVQNPRAALHECALGNTAGSVTLYLSAGTPPGKCWEDYGEWDKSNSILPFDRHKQNAPWMQCGEQTVEVECQTLDQWAADRPGVFDLAWIDVQGAELLVLQGAAQTIPRIHYVYAECDPRPNYKNQAALRDLKKHMKRAGFVYEGEFSGFNRLWRNLTKGPR
jgi:FkbM family methyltransferase